MIPRRLTQWTGCLALLGAHCLMPPPAPAGSAAPPENKAVPFGLALDGEASRERISVLERGLGLELGLVAIFIQFPADPRHDNFPADQLEAIRQAGARPVLTWEPMYIEDGAAHTLAASALTDGTYDPYLRRFARGVKALKEPVIIRFAHEMNLAHYHWGAASRAEYGPSAPERYRAMFRYVVRLFREEGAAEKARFAFNPNAESVPSPEQDPDASWNRPEAYYPGDGYVDVLGMDGYNWGTIRTHAEHGWESSFRPLAAILGPLYRTLRALAPEKPLYIFETASATAGGDKAEWIEQAAATAIDWELDGLVWFHHDKETDWRLDAGVGDAALVPLRRMGRRPGARQEKRPSRD